MKLTIKEAKEQGYERIGVKCDSWQTLILIEDCKNYNPLETRFYVAHTDGKNPSIDAESIKDALRDIIASNHQDDTGDDTDDVYDLVSSIDFESTAEMINEKLKEKTFYFLTDIELIY